MIHDQMFPEEGKFYTTLRQLMLQVERIEDMSSLGYDQPPASHSSTGKRPIPYLDASSSADRQPPARRYASSFPKPEFNEVGSFAYAVKHDAETISILGVTYSKIHILGRLKLWEEEFFLPAFLSHKGAAACPSGTQPGHERMDSTCHLFSTQCWR